MVLPWESASEPPPPVLVLGMHNSGTTMLAQILHHSGLFLANNAAHCESHFFSLFVNDRLIMGGGTAWAQFPIMTVEQVLARRDVVEPLVKQNWRMDYIQWGYDGCGPWGIKDPRLCVLLPLYLEMFPGAKLLLIRRDPDDVAASLAHRHKPGVGVKNEPQHWKSLTLRISSVSSSTRRVIPFLKWSMSVCAASPCRRPSACSNSWSCRTTNTRGSGCAQSSKPIGLERRTGQKLAGDAKRRSGGSKSCSGRCTMRCWAANEQRVRCKQRELAAALGHRPARGVRPRHAVLAVSRRASHDDPDRVVFHCGASGLLLHDFDAAGAADVCGSGSAVGDPALRQSRMVIAATERSAAGVG